MISCKSILSRVLIIVCLTVVWGIAVITPLMVLLAPVVPHPVWAAFWGLVMILLASFFTPHKVSHQFLFGDVWVSMALMAVAFFGVVSFSFFPVSSPWSVSRSRSQLGWVVSLGPFGHSYVVMGVTKIESGGGILRARGYPSRGSSWENLSPIDFFVGPEITTGTTVQFRAFDDRSGMIAVPVP